MSASETSSAVAYLISSTNRSLHARKSASRSPPPERTASSISLIQCAALAFGLRATPAAPLGLLTALAWWTALGPLDSLARAAIASLLAVACAKAEALWPLWMACALGLEVIVEATSSKPNIRGLLARALVSGSLLAARRAPLWSLWLPLALAIARVEGGALWFWATQERIHAAWLLGWVLVPFSNPALRVAAVILGTHDLVTFATHLAFALLPTPWPVTRAPPAPWSWLLLVWWADQFFSASGLASA